jgi:signal transduction histidine kinase
MFAPPGWFFSAVRAWYTVLAVELFAVCVIHFLVMLRQRRSELLPTSLAIIAGGALLGSEIAVQWGAVPARLSPASALLPLLFLLVGWRLFLTFARALRATEAGRSQLALRLQQLTSEFDQRVEEVTLRRVEEFTELERKRIASDLHDDLGAKLLTIVHTSDSARIPDLAREALEEMRLSVRGLAGKPVLLADALGDWRAEVVARLRQANIAALWEAPSEGISYVLPSRVFMQLTRILREAVSNVIKHSVASHCEIRWAVTAGILFLTVRDDGQGISADLNRGQGMLSMKRRAKKLNGQCLVGSRPGAGVLISLTVPLEASSAAVKSAAVT